MGDKAGIVFDDGELDELQRRLAGDPSLAPKALEEVLRKSYRVPMTGNEARAIIGEAGYEVVNIGSRGIGISVARREEFAIGQEVDLQLELQEQRFRLRGTVVHVSREADTFFLCGVRLDLTPEQETEFRRIVQRGRKALLAGS